MPDESAYGDGVVSWVDLMTTNVDEAKRFYDELFGWEWAGMEMPEAGTYWMASINGQLVAGLSAQPPDRAGMPSAWNTWMNVDDVDASSARAEAAGATVVVPPLDVPDAGRMAYLTDPAGAAFGMWQAREHKGAGKVDGHGSAIWHELHAPDTDATVAFYGEVFGWKRGSMEFPEGGSYTTLFKGEATIGGTAPPPEPGMPAHWRVWFGSDDVEATAAAAKDLGGTVVLAPTDSPIGKFAFLQDSTGAGFSVIKAG